MPSARNSDAIGDGLKEHFVQLFVLSVGMLCCSHVAVPRAGNDDELDSQNRNFVGKFAMSAYNGWMQPEESRKIALRHTTYEGRS